MDIELESGTVAGWIAAAVVGFASGAVVFYTPQPSRPDRVPAARQATITYERPESVGKSVPSAPPLSAELPARVQSSPPPAGVQAPSTLQEQAGVRSLQPVAPPYGAAAAGGTASAGATPSPSEPSRLSRDSGGFASGGGAGVAFAPAAASAPAQERPPEPILRVGGYSIQGDSVLETPPTVDARRDYRMSIDVSKIP